MTTTANTLLVLACATLLSAAGGGCIGIGAGDSDAASSAGRARASRGSFAFGRKKQEKAAAEERAREHAAALEGYTPESSMTRDLQKLQTREREQTQLVARLAETRDTNPERFRQEQERLSALRDQIAAYDTALQNFEMAARTRPERNPDIPPAVIPAEMFRDRPVQDYVDYAGHTDYAAAGDYGTYQASRDQTRLDGYGRNADDNVTHARINMNEGYAEEGERVLYSATGQNNLAAAYANGRPLSGPGAYPPQEEKAVAAAYAPESPIAKPFAGAPVGRSNARASGRNTPGADQPAENALKPWEKDAPLYADRGSDSGAGRSAQTVPNMYSSRGRSEETLWPAGTAMVPPAGSRTTPRPPAKTEVRLPAPGSAAKPSATPPAKPAPAASAPADAGMDDEIFSPSMFLGSGR